MNDAAWFMYAAMAVWLGLGGYLFFLGRTMASLETRMSRLEYAQKKSATGRDGE